ncbi:MAG: c-type cytochrome domain-containing protein, partial [Prosthecobacter sp.]|nr:c-type cytochrome domain-containing protein [Prosthecobacter sp.]
MKARSPKRRNTFVPTRFLFLSALLTLADPARALDYTREIKPLLKAQCIKCHGTILQKGGLRLDTAAAARRGGDRGAAIIPGRGDDSLLVQAIQGAHAEIPQMPYKRGPLDAAQMALLKQWIDEGAQAPADEQPSDDRHWAYGVPARPPVPKLRRQPGNPIDAFIQDRLIREGLQPSPPAAAETQMRRVWLDLTGLPPKGEETAALAAGSNGGAAPLARPRQCRVEQESRRWLHGGLGGAHREFDFDGAAEHAGQRSTDGPAALG